MFAIPGERVARVHTSSGTTGKPTVVGDTPNDNDTRAKLVARSFRAGAVRPGMSVHSAVGCGLFTGGLGMPQGAEPLGCGCERHDRAPSPIVRDFKPDVTDTLLPARHPRPVSGLAQSFRSAGHARYASASGSRRGLQRSGSGWSGQCIVHLDVGHAQDHLAASAAAVA
jgi:hypothetical protein